MYLLKTVLYIHNNQYTNKTCKCNIFIVHEDKKFYEKLHKIKLNNNNESYRTCICCKYTMWTMKNNYIHKGKIKDSEKIAKFLLEMLK